jgi:DNA-binding XRE family transcriptional regulator
MNKRQKAIRDKQPGHVMTAAEWEYATDDYKELRKGIMNNNHVKKIRELQMMSKAELARQANVSVQTIDRIEKGHECRLDTRRKIIIALGYKLDQKSSIFPE